MSTTTNAPAVPEDLDRLLRRMRLPYLRKTVPDVLATARARRWDPAEVLRVLLDAEVTGRNAATRRMRRKKAQLPKPACYAVIDAFPQVSPLIAPICYASFRSAS
jgi:hypothetical protein